MTDELEELARALRQRADEEADLDRLAEAPLSAEERTRLEEALGVGAEEARAAYAPLSDAALARMSDAALAAVQREDRPSAELSREAEPAMTSVRKPERGLRLRTGAPWLAGGFAAAAAAMLWLAAGSGPLPLGDASYQLEVRGAVSQTRSGSASANAEPLLLRADSQLTLTSRPSQPVEGELRLRAFLIGGGAAPGDRSGAPIELEAQSEQAPSGSLRSQVRLPERIPAAGRLIALVGRPEALDAAPRSLLSGADRGPGWRRLDRPFRRDD